MQSGAKASGPVLAPSAAVVVAGVARDVDSVSITRELATDLPGDIVGGGGVTAATGTLEASVPVDVTTAPPHPWARRDGWPPKAGDAVTVDMSAGNGAAFVRQLTGRLDRPAGSLSSSTVTCALVDNLDAMRRQVSFPPRSAALTTSGDSLYYPPGTAMSTLALAAAACGFRTGVPTTANTYLSVPCVAGSCVPEIGSVPVTYTDGGSYRWVAAPWGTGATDLNTAPTSNVVPALANKTMDLTFDAYVTGSTSQTFQVRGYNYLLAVTVSATTVSAGLGGVTASCARSGSWSRVTARVGFDSNGPARVDLWEHDPRNPPTASGANLPARVANVKLKSQTSKLQDMAGGIKLSLSNSLTSGQVGSYAFGGLVLDVLPTPADPSLRAYATTAPPVTARYEISTTDPMGDAGPLLARPAIVGRVASELVKEIATALVASVWLDERGVLQVVGRKAMTERATVCTLTSSTDLLELAWSDDLSSLRHVCSVQHTQPSKVTTPDPFPLVWMAPALSLPPGTSYSEIIHPPDDQDWINLDTSVTLDGSGGAGSRYGTGGSSQALNVSVTPLDSQSWAVRVSAPSSNTATVTNTLSDSSTHLDGSPTPILYAEGAVQWAETTVNGSPVGPDYAPDLVHDAGVWVQDSSLASANALANALAARLATTSPTIESLDIIPDLRLQLGDRVTVVDDGRSNVSIDGIVSGINTSVSSGDLSMSVSLRVMGVQVKVAAWSDFDSLWSGGTWDDFDATWSDNTWPDFDTQPIQREAAGQVITTPSGPVALGDVDTTQTGRTLGAVDTTMSGQSLDNPPT